MRYGSAQERLCSHRKHTINKKWQAERQPGKIFGKQFFLPFYSLAPQLPRSLNKIDIFNGKYDEKTVLCLRHNFD